MGLRAQGLPAAYPLHLKKCFSEFLPLISIKRKYQKKQKVLSKLMILCTPPQRLVNIWVLFPSLLGFLFVLSPGSFLWIPSRFVRALPCTGTNNLITN